MMMKLVYVLALAALADSASANAVPEATTDLASQQALVNECVARVAEYLSRAPITEAMKKYVRRSEIARSSNSASLSSHPEDGLDLVYNEPMHGLRVHDCAGLIEFMEKLDQEPCLEEFPANVLELDVVPQIRATEEASLARAALRMCRALEGTFKSKESL